MESAKPACLIIAFAWAIASGGGLKALPGGEKARRPATQSDALKAAVRTYVPPGMLDEYYLFVGNGHSGNVGVYGLPSMRPLVTIPVFTPYPATGYGFDKESKEMLGGYTWGDVHHPSFSETNGDYDGRWLFVSDVANNRMARIDLRDFKTKQVLGPLPNVSGNHCSSFATENTEYLLAASRFSIPLPKGTYEKTEDYATKYRGIVAGIAVNPKSGDMSLGWQVMTPPFQFDYGDGIPVLNPDSVKQVEIKTGPGSLHTQFDDKGYAYTSLYGEGDEADGGMDEGQEKSGKMDGKGMDESIGGGAIVKWKLGTWDIVDRIQVAYNIGHLAIPGGDAKHPVGQYLVSINKTGRAGQHLGVGPMQPKSLQLIDISGKKMKLLYETFADPESARQGNERPGGDEIGLPVPAEQLAAGTNLKPS